MNKFLETVSSEMEFRNLKKSDRARKIDVPDPTVRSWYAKDSFPTVDTAYKIAEALNCSVEYLMTGEKEYKISHREPLIIHQNSAEESELLMAYSQLSSRNKALFIGILNLLQKDSECDQ